MKQSQAIILHQLAAHGAPGTKRPSHNDVGMRELIFEADQWWEVRILADLVYPAVLMKAGPDASDRVRELYGLFGSAAEQAMLVGAVEIEVEYLRRAIANDDLPGGMVLAQRWFSEHESQTLLGIGHLLMNMALRVGLLDPHQRSKILACKRFKRFVDERGSDDRATWKALSSKDLDALYGILLMHGIASPGTSKHVKAIVVVVKRLADSDAWRYLDEQRGEDFHRWRRESSVLAGIGSTPRPYTPGSVIRAGINIDGYDDANEMEEYLADINRDAISVVVETMKVVRENVAEIVEIFASGDPVAWREES